MHPVAAAAILAALIHVWFMQPRAFTRFGLASADQAAVARSFACNQGFYNLFLGASSG